MLIDTAMDLKMGLIKVVMGDFVSIYILVYKLHTSIRNLFFFKLFFETKEKLNHFAHIYIYIYHFPSG